MVLSGGTIVSSLLCTRLLKKLGTGGVTVLSVALTAAALLGYSVAPGAVWLFLLAVPLGLGAGAIDSALNNFVALHYRAIHMSWLHCFWGVGATLGPVLLSVCLAGGDDWRQGYRAIGLIQAALAVLLAATLPLWKRAEGSDAAAGEEQARSYPIRELLRVRGAVPVLLSFFCYCAIESVTGLGAAAIW